MLKNKFTSDGTIGGRNIADQLKAAVLHYAEGFPPYHSAIQPDQAVLDWWQQLPPVAEAAQLREFAIQIYSASPTSMADERTASKMSELNAARKNRQLPSTIIHTAQIRQWNRYHSGLEDMPISKTLRINFHAINHDIYENRNPARDIKKLLNTVCDDPVTAEAVGVISEENIKEAITLPANSSDIDRWMEESAPDPQEVAGLISTPGTAMMVEDIANTNHVLIPDLSYGATSGHNVASTSEVLHPGLTAGDGASEPDNEGWDVEKM